MNGLAQLGDALTKSSSRKTLLQLLTNNHRWRLVHDEKFVSGRKLKKRKMLEKIREQQDFFVGEVARMAREKRWPWDEEVRRMGDDLIGLACTSSRHVSGA